MRAVDLAEIFDMAADYVEGRQYHSFVGGPDLWSAVPMACWDLVTGPASEQLRRMVGTAELQYWRGTQAEAVQLLRKASSAGDQLSVLREEYAARRLEGTRRALLAAMGWEGSDADLGSISQAIADEVKQLRAENERLSEKIRSIHSRRP